ncbi:class I SAM-dependent RNA methyltransferase [Aurantimonas sp. Leaf443]|uniref:class I SAM-dependent RNA methyltransferase n=1 Tax=Aurantimonas sp. Leaf443 TaxID=1736378 RepID=UPI0006FA76F4|nr:class I SAM-dependent RNA methyltransferase [Aurantimonas sp. Leaf443]KQT88054.1 RNA methyltransferase [Aurantimonas sp. Leaf443]
MSEIVTIERLATKGDGVAAGSGLFVPFTLPGERVSVEREARRARLLSVIEASPERVEPPCPHFGACGGCDLQHASDDLYRAFKRGLVADALAREGVSAEVAPLVPCAPASRRRVTLTAVRAGGRVLLGYNAALTNTVVAIETCPISLPAIVAALPALRRIAALLVDRKRPLRLTVTHTASGLDVSAEDARKLDDKVRQDAISQTLADGLARLSVAGEILVEQRPVLVSVGPHLVPLPPGAFVQAVAATEAAMADLVTAHLSGARRVADLFAGFGAFGLRLAHHAAVHAVEGEAKPLEALTATVRQTPGLKPVTTEKRDLFRRPVTAKELNRFDALVFDPPRAGAEAQAREIAASNLSRVAAVSCNPVTLARDLSILTQAGFAVTSATPFDQFLWSHHVEAVALLERRG